MIAKVIVPHSFPIDTSDGFIVGVDYGAYELANKQVKMDLAIGDFDSVTKSEFELIEKFAAKIIKLSVDKNETDSEAAIMYCKDNGFTDITVYGDIGKRLDHLLVNIKLVEKYNVTYKDAYNKVKSYPVGEHKIKNDYDILSLITREDCLLSLKGCLYELEKVTLNYFDTYMSSNKIIEDYAQLNVYSGVITIIQSLDK